MKLFSWFKNLFNKKTVVEFVEEKPAVEKKEFTEPAVEELTKVTCILTGSGEMFDTVDEIVEKYPNFTKRGIRACLAGTQKTHDGETFEFIDILR